LGRLVVVGVEFGVFGLEFAVVFGNLVALLILFGQ
jgi:hypothetical protein